MRFLPEGFYIKSGDIRYKGNSVFSLKNSEIIDFRGRVVYYLNQDPFVAFDPTFKIEFQIKEYLKAKRIDYEKKKLLKILDDLGFEKPEKVLKLYPFELSGGMLQRVSIARALMIESEVLIADEITTGLDFELQIELLKILETLVEKKGLSIIIITHNLKLLEYLKFSNVYVLYAGEIIEENGNILNYPLHPYTEDLILSDPALWKKRGKIHFIDGFLPLSKDNIQGCVFYDRCKKRLKICKEEKPHLYIIKGRGKVKCFLYEDYDNTK